MKAVFLGLFIFVCSCCEALAFPVPSPDRLYISAESSYGSISLNNDADAPTTLHLSIKEWRQNLTGSAILSPTTDLEISPREIYLKPHESINVSVRVLKAPPPNTEKAYRMVMTGLDIPASAEGVEMKATVDMPILLGTPQQGEKFFLSSPIISGNDIRFNIRNDGMRIGRPDNISVRGLDGKGASIFNANVRGWYVFPGSYMKYLFSVSTPDCAKLRTVIIAVDSRSNKLEKPMRGAWKNSACNNPDISVSAFRADEPIVKSIAQPNPLH